MHSKESPDYLVKACKTALKSVNLRNPLIMLVMGCLVVLDEGLDEDLSLLEILAERQVEVISLAEFMDEAYLKICANSCNHKAHDPACVDAFRKARAVHAIMYTLAHALDADPIQAANALREVRAAIDETDEKHGH